MKLDLRILVYKDASTLTTKQRNLVSGNKNNFNKIPQMSFRIENQENGTIFIDVTFSKYSSTVQRKFQTSSK